MLIYTYRLPTTYKTAVVAVQGVRRNSLALKTRVAECLGIDAGKLSTGSIPLEMKIVHIRVGENSRISKRLKTGEKPELDELFIRLPKGVVTCEIDHVQAYTKDMVDCLGELLDSLRIERITV